MNKPKAWGRGSLNKVQNPFEKHSYEEELEYKEAQYRAGENPWADQKTQFTAVDAKSIVNPVKSPDIGHNWSLNPYQGCEHGCSYCYARNSHAYWGLDAGLDFERAILVKKNAPQLLSRFLERPSWQAEAIMLSGNTDCYQPIERKLKITRAILEVFLAYRNPVGLITKNSLIERDVDLLKKLAQENLVQVAFSINTLNEDLRRKMEPRTASVKRRLQAVENLSKNGIPVKVMIAPIIPGLNSHEVLPIAKAAATAGAVGINYTLLRLNGQLPDIFLPWLKEHFPNHYQKVTEAVSSLHGGNLNDSQFGRRMRGDGNWASQIKQQIELARKRHFADSPQFKYNTQAFRHLKKGQYGLFD